MSLHSRVFHAALRDDKFLREMRGLGSQTLMLAEGKAGDTLAQGVLGAGYLGWLVGRYGSLTAVGMYNAIKAE
jgi:hypothetical protein